MKFTNQRAGRWRAWEAALLVCGKKAGWILVAAGWLLAGGEWTGAAEDPQAAPLFEAARLSFGGKFYDRAEKELAEFIAKYPESGRVGEAVVLQAQARFELKRYAGVVELLTGRLPKAGPLGDQYHYWIAEAEFARGQYKNAADSYRQLLQLFPESGLRLKASTGEAFSLFRLNNAKRAVELLKDPAGAFQTAAAKSTDQAEIARGYLLLGEAYFAEKNYRAAEEALKQLEGRQLHPEAEWQRQFLMATSALADGRVPDAIRYASNSVVVARAAGLPVREASSLSFQAANQEPAAAISTYQEILKIKEIPATQQRQALFDGVDLMLTLGQLTNAIALVQTYLAQNFTNVVADPARSQDQGQDSIQLRLGELYLRQYYSTNSSAAGLLGQSNILQNAKSQFDAVIARTNSLHLGKAYLNRGWCYWEEAQLGLGAGKLQEAQSSFQAAAERLPVSLDQAVARLKLAECQLSQNDLANALRNSMLLLEQYAGEPQIRTNVLDRGLYQVVRINVDLGDWERAGQAVDRLMKEFPTSGWSEQALFHYGQGLLSGGIFLEARRRLIAFQGRFTNSILAPKVQMAIAQTYVKERKWPEAIEQYASWLKQFTNHVLRPQIEWDRAMTYYKADQDTNALVLLTNFVTQYTNSALAPRARFWVGEYYFRQGDFLKAESQYAAASTEASTNDLSYQARLMAAKAAFLRDKPPDARNHLTNLLSDRLCPPRWAAEGYLLLGDVALKEGQVGLPFNEAQSLSNTVRRLGEAITSFDRILSIFPTNHLEPVARGKIANCYFQLAGIDTNRAAAHLAAATNEYSKVMASAVADVATRSQAELGLANALEKQAELEPGEMPRLLEAALNHCLDIVYGRQLRVDKGETADPFWVKRAGLRAGALAERLQWIPQAIGIYEQLQAQIPQMQSELANKVEVLKREAARRKEEALRGKS